MEPQEYEAIRQTLEGIARKQLEDAADLSRLFTGMDSRITLAEQTLRDVRLTMAGIGSLAKSLAERQQAGETRTQGHEDILKSLAGTLGHQDTITARLLTLLEEQRQINTRQETFNAEQQRINGRLEVILQGIKDLLERGNGR